MSDKTDKIDNKTDKKEINMEAPLSARVDPYYKQKFYDILDDKSYMNTKDLMENMILTYISNDREAKKEEHISFKNEISSITELTNTLLSTFKSMASKSQDTINGKVDFYEQQIKNLKLDIETLNSKNDEMVNKITNENNELTEVNNKLQLINDSFENEKSALQQEIDRLQNELSGKDESINKLKSENSDYIKEIKVLSKLEKENEKLLKDNEKIKKENNILTESIELVKNKAEVDAKIKINDIQSKYNELQIDYLKLKEELTGIKQGKKNIILEG